MTSSVVYASLAWHPPPLWGSVVQKTLRSQSLDEIRRTPIDRIDPAASASIVRRVLRREPGRSEVARFTSAI
jgi:hypothetical protein